MSSFSLQWYFRIFSFKSKISIAILFIHAKGFLYLAHDNLFFDALISVFSLTSGAYKSNAGLSIIEFELA